MPAEDDLDRVLQRWHLAQDEFVRGNPGPVKEMWSHTEDVSVANPYGPPVRGWEKVSAVVEHAASQRRDGEATGFEVVAKGVTAEVVLVVALAWAGCRGGDRAGGHTYAVRARMLVRP